MRRNRVVALVLVFVLVAGVGTLGWVNRLELLLWAAPRLNELRNPVAPNEPIEWPEGPATAAAPPSERPPNLIVILADDMGFNDVSFYNGGAADGTLQTPHIDSIARDEDSPEVVNAKQDFDVIDRMVWATTQYAAQFDGSHSFEPEGYLTDYYTDEAIRVIEANRNQPFFLYLAHWGVHNPLQARKSDYDALVHIEDHRLRVYAAMILALDRGVGRVLDKLEELGLDENTLVVFTSDNGGAGYLGLPDVNRPYRGWKLTHFEGGTHVPFFAKWPARIAPGSVLDAPVSHIDLLPTLATAVGARLPDDRIIDGVDLLPYVLRGGGQIAGLEARPHETLFWRQGYLQTVQHRDWKLITTTRPDQRWLFDLAADPTEQRNLAAERPEVVATLEDLLARHDATQAEPLWPSVIEFPVLIDKTGAEPYVEGDEYSYWPN